MAPCSPQRAVLAPSPALPFPTVPIPVLAQAPAEQGHHFSPQQWILSAAKCLFCQHVPNPQPKADENTMGGRMGMSCPLRQSPGGDSHSPNGGGTGILHQCSGAGVSCSRQGRGKALHGAGTASSCSLALPQTRAGSQDPRRRCRKYPCSAGTARPQ